MKVFMLIVALNFKSFISAQMDFDSDNGQEAITKSSMLKQIKKNFNWTEYKEKYGNVFDDLTSEYHRLITFMKNSRFIRQHNARYENGEESYMVEVNHLTDWPIEEFQKLNGYRNDLRKTVREMPRFFQSSNATLSYSVDWRSKGYVTPVKDQGSCGSCWSFSSTGSLEGQHMRATGKLVDLSEQNLIDCSKLYGNHGCNGGLMDNAFTYIKNNHGIDTENSYPYEAKDGKCRFRRKSIGATDRGFTDIISGDEESLKEAVAVVGPISVAIDASRLSFRSYKHGIYYDKKCSCENLNHGVLIVGYGTNEKYGDYWIVKNSWGKKWELGGYILMARNRRNHCGISTAASYPMV